MRTTQENLTLKLSTYQGGVAIWGAIPAVFDTTNEPFDSGIHVHARRLNSRKKIIDKTFSSVEVRHNNISHMICEKAAIAFAMTSIFEINMVALPCNACGNLILDNAINAVIPGVNHYCNHCHSYIITHNACVANPLIQLKKYFDDEKSIRETIDPDRTLSLDHNRFSGGIQLWGSNPSILWTAERREETGIHVHAYSNDGKRIIDNTYSFIEILGEKIDAKMVRLLQVQLALPEIKKYLGCLSCPSCHHTVFGQGIKAVRPNTEHLCLHCNQTWKSNPVISNPAYTQLKYFNPEGIR